MLSKCANPGCSAKFHYFHVGKLFRCETQSGEPHAPEFGADPTVKKSVRRVEFFWLCPECSGNMTLTFQQGAGVIATPAVLSANDNPRRASAS
ncbi:MAG TPA: hypothetical protein VN684_03810 [Terriglobales bacterium]|nr:hypothetical protein [Terriglobales bacterium]